MAHGALTRWAVVHRASACALALAALASSIRSGTRPSSPRIKFLVVRLAHVCSRPNPPAMRHTSPPPATPHATPWAAEVDGGCRKESQARNKAGRCLQTTRVTTLTLIATLTLELGREGEGRARCRWMGRPLERSFSHDDSPRSRRSSSVAEGHVHGWARSAVDCFVGGRRHGRTASTVRRQQSLPTAALSWQAMLVH